MSFAAGELRKAIGGKGRRGPTAMTQRQKNGIEMTQEQKSRWIAEKLEPIPSKEAISGRFSKTEYWVGTEDGDWRPRDMINDPAMQDMIEDWFFARFPYFFFGNTCIKWEFEGSGREIEENFYCELPLMDRRQAKVDAFMLANGFKESQ